MPKRRGRHKQPAAGKPSAGFYNQPFYGPTVILENEIADRSRNAIAGNNSISAD
jgi:hypothetical protein